MPRFTVKVIGVPDVIPDGPEVPATFVVNAENEGQARINGLKSADFMINPRVESVEPILIQGEDP